MKDSFLNKRLKYTYSNACLWLAAINVLVFLVTDFWSPEVSGLPIKYWLAMNPIMVRMGYVWQVFTYMFCHADWTHLLLNCYGLIMFGAVTERAVGSREFVLFYLVCGTLSGAASFLVYYFTGQYYTYLLGASGAVYAVEFLVAVLAPNMRVLLFWLIPVKMPLAVLLFTAIELFEQIASSTDGISHLVHLMGMLFAWLYCIVRFRVHPLRVWSETLSGPKA